MATTNVESPKAAKPNPPAKPGSWIPGTIAIAIAVVAAFWLLATNNITAIWPQNYDPLGNWLLSTLVAALPIILLLGSLALGHIKAHYAALAGLFTALVIAIFVFHMPGRLGLTPAVYGGGAGWF